MARKSKVRSGTSFLITLTACLAFLVGAVKIWGVPADKLWSGLALVLVMLAVLVGLALVLVLAVKKLSSRRKS